MDDSTRVSTPAAPQPGAPRSGKPSLRQRLGRIGRSVLFIYLAVMLGCSMLQEQLIFPGHASQGQSHARINPPADSELVELKTSLGDTIYVLFGRAMNADGSSRNDAESRPTLIFFYGNAMSLSDATDFCRSWRKLGANVLGVEYPGYGMSSGKPGEAPFYAAADAAYDHLIGRDDIDRTRIIPLGLSIGSGVAVDLAHRRPVAGLALLSPYTSLTDLAREVMPWFPTSLILRHHFRNDLKIGSIDVPVLLVHGRNDRIIPAEMTTRLSKLIKPGQASVLFVDSDHNDLFQLAGDEVDAAIGALVEQVAQQLPPEQ